MEAWGSCVGNTRDPHWLWHAIDHCTGKVVADVLGRRNDDVLLQRTALHEPVGLSRDDTDHWGAYPSPLDPAVQSPSPRPTLQIARTQWT
jgi:insertion element IS1 protein InsB